MCCEDIFNSKTPSYDLLPIHVEYIVLSYVVIHRFHVCRWWRSVSSETNAMSQLQLMKVC